MKKYIISIIICLIVIFGLLYFTYGKEIVTLLDEKRVYSVKNAQETELYTLEEYMFFNDGIITFNNKKIVFLEYNNDAVWENEETEFAKQVFVSGKYIFRKTESNVQIIDKNNQKFVITEIKGDLINVSRENDKTYMIVRNESGDNSLYIINDNNDIIVENKGFDGKITGVSISDRSEGYSLITLSFDEGNVINTIYLNLLDDVELWKTTIENEILIKTQIVNNNVIAIGTNNIYYYNFNGKLMWKNNIFRKILDYEIKKDEQKILILFEKDDNNELVTYNFEGKVLEINKISSNARKLKVYGSKTFVYGNNGIYLLHNGKSDKIYDTENIITDFIVEGKEINILFNNKIVRGLIK